jgi:preprotein translocase subunit SecG
LGGGGAWDSRNVEAPLSKTNLIMEYFFFLLFLLAILTKIRKKLFPILDKQIKKKKKTPWSECG